MAYGRGLAGFGVHGDPTLGVVLEGSDGPELHTARDLSKDQSYYLFELDQEQLAAAVFPLGDRSKNEVRELARRAGLLVAEKAESMEVCFVSGGIREFVEREVAQGRTARSRVGTPGPSRVVDAQGRLLGAAEPYYRYTVGQRRGLGVAAGERLYVLRVEPEANRLVVGREHERLSPGLRGERLHWIGPDPGGEVEATVRIRAPISVAFGRPSSSPRVNRPRPLLAR